MMIQAATGTCVLGGVPWSTGRDRGVAKSSTIRLQRPFARPWKKLTLFTFTYCG
jgi:hypothetical protein